MKALTLEHVHSKIRKRNSIREKLDPMESRQVIIPVACRIFAGIVLNQSLSIHHEVIHDLTLAHGKMKTAGDYCVRHLSPRGGRAGIGVLRAERIHHPYLGLPRQGEGNKMLPTVRFYNAWSPNPIFEGSHEGRKPPNFEICVSSFVLFVSFVVVNAG